MWNPITMMLGTMLLIGIVTVVFMLPDAIQKYVNSKSQQLAWPAADSDAAAVRMLGESLRRAKVSAETAADLLAAFWAATPPNRRALAHRVAGMLADGPVDDEALLHSVLRSLPATSLTSDEAEQRLPSSTAIRE